MRNDAPFRRSNSKLVGASFLVGRSGATPIAARWARREKSSHCCLADDVGRYVGASPSGKAPVFGSGIRRFESFRPSQFLSDKLQFVESEIMASFRLVGQFMGTTGRIKVFSGTAHRGLADEICRALSCDLGKAT